MTILSVKNAADQVFKNGFELASGYLLHQFVANVEGEGIGQLTSRMDILTNLSVASSLRFSINYGRVNVSSMFHTVFTDPDVITGHQAFCSTVDLAKYGAFPS